MQYQVCQTCGIGCGIGCIRCVDVWYGVCRMYQVCQTCGIGCVGCVGCVRRVLFNVVSGVSCVSGMSGVSGVYRVCVRQRQRGEKRRNEEEEGEMSPEVACRSRKKESGAFA